MVTAQVISGVAPLRVRGFTLLELLIVIVVLGILATIATPSLRGLLVTSQLRSAASDLYESLILARSEAIKRATSVNVVPASGGDFTTGWSVMAGTTLIEKRDAPVNVTITPLTTCTPSTVASITYGIDGRVSTGRLSLTVCTTVAPYSITPRCVLVDASGRPSIRNNACS